jgi:predicted GIY-YIG superfamily endonuclease
MFKNIDSVKVQGVYFIRNNKNGSIKIGSSKDIFKRFSQLVSKAKSTGEKFPDLELVYYFPCAQYKELERKLHHVFSARRITNEWFLASIEEITQIIDRLKNRYS